MRLPGTLLKTGVLTLFLLGNTIAQVCSAADCKDPDRDKSIASVLKDNPGSKVLNVSEVVGDNGCIDLKLRIIANGTVKEVVIKGK